MSLTSKCVICLAVFGDWPSFNKHHQLTHGIFSVAIRPERTTNRTKAQIISDFEQRHPEMFALDRRVSEPTTKEWVG